MPSMITVLSPDELQGEHRITRQVTTIGASRSNSIQLDHPTIAPVHVSLIDEEGRYLLSALKHGSRGPP